MLHPSLKLVAGQTLYDALLPVSVTVWSYSFWFQWNHSSSLTVFISFISYSFFPHLSLQIPQLTPSFINIYTQSHMFRWFHSRTGPVHMKPHIHSCVINHFHLYGLLHFSQSHHYHLPQSPPIPTWQSRQEQTETANRKVKRTLASLARFASVSSWTV